MAWHFHTTTIVFLLHTPDPICVRHRGSAFGLIREIRIRHSYNAFMIRGLSLCCCVALSVLPLAGQNPPVPPGAVSPMAKGFSDSGVFRIRRDGKEVGQEKFNIRWEGEVLKAESDIDLKVPQSAAVSLHTELVIDAAGKVVSYRAARTGPGPQKEMEVTIDKQVAICEEKTGNVNESIPVWVDSGFVLLDTNVFHHFELLVARLLGDKFPELIPVLIPQEQVSGKMKIVAVGKETLKIGKQKFLVSQFQLDSGQVKISVWFDDAGRLYRISVPQTKAEVSRIMP
jgi:hypothetical protein